ncbi:MAG: cytochrome b561 domain-containing protein [Pseudomonadota bacterium]
MLEWLLAPLDATRPHDVGFHLSWHARFMVLAWGVLVPTGVLAARYFKIMPNQSWPHEVDNRTWWNTHRACQYSAAALTVVSIIVIRLAPEVTWSSGLHYIFGWTVVGLAVLQIAGGIMRGSKGGPTEPAPDGTLSGDHYDMTRRRIVFEYTHKTLGYFALLVAAIAILTGMWQANAPRWMVVFVVSWWGALATIAVWLQSRGMCVDTYQALWGPSADHPGNKREKPIGYRVRRIHGEPGE